MFIRPFIVRSAAHTLSRASSTLVDGHASELKSALSYCVEQVRRFDKENYTWLVQMPKDLRRPIFALRALNIETALIGEQVQSKEAALVQIRIQWWRDAIDAVFRGKGSLVPKHPVVLALQRSIEGVPGIKKYNVKRILDAREADLLDPQPPLDLSGLESYAESTATQLLLLQLGAAGITNRDADHAVSHLGKAIGITTLLRGTAHHASRRRSYLPLDLCAEHGVSQEDLYSGRSSDGLRDVVLKVASVAKAHLDESRALKLKLPPLLLSSGMMLGSVSFIPAFDEMLWTKQNIWKMAKQPNALLYTNPTDEDSKLRSQFPHAKDFVASSFDGPTERRDPSLKPLDLNEGLDGANLGAIYEQHIRPASIAAHCPMCHMLVAQVWRNATLEMVERLRVGGFSGMKNGVPTKTHLRSLLVNSCSSALSPNPDDSGENSSSVDAMIESQATVRIHDPSINMVFFVVNKRNSESPKATEHERKALEIACKNVAQLASTLSQPMSNAFTMTPSRLEEAIKSLELMKETAIDRNQALAIITVIKQVIQEVHEEYIDPYEEEEEDGEEEEEFEDLDCMDLHVMCRKWADTGECEANPKYMVGTNILKGHCRKSCGVCIPQRPKGRPEAQGGSSESGSTEADIEALEKAYPALRGGLAKLFKSIHNSIRTEACTAAKVCLQLNSQTVEGAAQEAAAQGQWKLGTQFYGLAEVKVIQASTAAAPPGSPSFDSESSKVESPGGDSEVAEEQGLNEVGDKDEPEPLSKQVSRALSKDLGGKQLSISADFFDYFYTYKNVTSQSGSHPTTLSEHYLLGTFQRESVEVLEASTGLPATLHSLDLLPNLASILSQMEWPYVKQVYNGGDECVLGGGRRVQRKVEARVACSPDARIHMLVREPDFCSYVYVVFSPALCEVSRFKPKFRGVDVEILNVAEGEDGGLANEEEVESEEEKEFFEFGQKESRLGEDDEDEYE